MGYIRDVKNKIRDEYRAKRLALDPAYRKTLDERILKQLRSLASFRFAETVLAYFPLEGEIDIRPLLEEALAMGKKVALPYSGEGGIMDFYYISSLDELIPGRFGLMEPPTTNEKYEKNNASPVLMIIPALVFDHLGYRLGYGRGYYDRYVNGFSGAKAGISYASFLRSTPLPRGRFDFAVDYIVTEKGVKLVEKI